MLSAKLLLLQKRRFLKKAPFIMRLHTCIYTGCKMEILDFKVINCPFVVITFLRLKFIIYPLRCLINFLYYRNNPFFVKVLYGTIAYEYPLSYHVAFKTFFFFMANLTVLFFIFCFLIAVYSL